MCDSRSDEQIARDIRSALEELKLGCAVLIGRGWNVNPSVSEYSMYSQGIAAKSIKDWSIVISKINVETI